MQHMDGMREMEMPHGAGQGLPHQDLQELEWEQAHEGITMAKGEIAQCEGESPMSLNTKIPLNS